MKYLIETYSSYVIAKRYNSVRTLKLINSLKHKFTNDCDKHQLTNTFITIGSDEAITQYLKMIANYSNKASILVNCFS